MKSEELAQMELDVKEAISHLTEADSLLHKVLKIIGETPLIKINS